MAIERERELIHTSAARGKLAPLWGSGWMASEVVLPSAGKGEFPRLQDTLAQVEGLLVRAAAGVAPDSADSDALAAHFEAKQLIQEMSERAGVFEKRAREPDPDKRIYGPKMAQKVLEFIEALQAASEHAEELDEALAPLRARLAAAEVAAAAAVAATAEAAAQAELEALATAAAEQAELDEEVRLASERASVERAAAIARPLGSGSGDASFQRLEAADTVDALGRRKLTADLSLTQSLELLEASCEVAEFASALQALHLLCANIVARPEEALFRKVRLLNASFQQTVARYPGGVEALLALGFEESETLEGDEEAVCYVLEEPNLEEDIERWGRWYDGIKAHQAELIGRMEAHGVRALPVAAKGTGWAEGMTAPPPARPADNLTLHGQRGGGI